MRCERRACTGRAIMKCREDGTHEVCGWHSLPCDAALPAPAPDEALRAAWSEAERSAVQALGLVVRWDAARAPDAPRWTVAIPGVGRGDGHTPQEAGAALLRLLTDRAT